MYHRFKICLIVIGIITISGCSKKEVSPCQSTTMKQIYYTQEGKPYVIKTVTRQSSGTYAVPTGLGTSVIINMDSIPITTQYLTISLSTPRKIIPVSCSFSLSQGGGVAPDVDVQSVYYGMTRGNVPNYDSWDHMSAISKMIPLANKIFYASNQLYGYNVFYNQAVLTESDFIDMTGGVIFFFGPELSNALTNTSMGGATIPAVAFRSNVVFTYFELL